MSMNDSDLIERLHAVAEGFQMPPTTPADDVSRGRRRVRRNRGLVAAAAAASVAVVIGVTAAVGGQDPVEPAPIEQPNQPDSQGIFADIHGWMVYGDRTGIWAMNPSRPADQEPKLVIDRPGQPLGWSSDGTKLLIARSLDDEPRRDSEYDLLVLDADGTENRVARGGFYLDGSISPDGTQVIYSDAWSGNAGIHTVGTHGGTPRLLLAPEPHEQQGTVFDRETYFPVFSPDGTKIAYFDGHGDWGHRLRVMNTDGTDSRTLHDSDNHIRGLAWSPDAQRLIFADDVGVWAIGIDGSGLAKVAGSSPAWTGSYPSWSSDGSRISYQRDRKLYVANADGTQATLFAHVSSGWGRSAQWNPLPLEGGAK
jgi:hypothetical protein